MPEKLRRDVLKRQILAHPTVAESDGRDCPMHRRLVEGMTTLQLEHYLTTLSPSESAL